MSTEISCDGEILIGNFRAALHDPRPVGLRRPPEAYGIGEYRRVCTEFDKRTNERTTVAAPGDKEATGGELVLEPGHIDRIEELLQHFDEISESGSFVGLIQDLRDFMVKRPGRLKFVFLELFD